VEERSTQKYHVAAAATPVNSHGFLSGFGTFWYLDMV
jgi:hypothetical protein